MSESQNPEPTDLESVIEQNPEAVAEFVEHLDAVNELLDVLSLGESALDDEMVRELSATGPTLAESADGLATDETVALAETVGKNGDELREALDTLLALQRSGTLDDLAEFAEVGSLAAAALDDGMEVVAVLDGDGQMDPTDLNRLLDPIVSGVADYAKGDRLRDSTHRREMSGWRLFGNALLTLLTRAASGYWGMSDPQNGFTAISRDALEDIEVDRLYEDYGFLNDVLVQLNVVGARVADVSMRARYGEEESGIQYRSFVPRLSWLLCRRFVWRLRVASTSSRRPVAPLYGLAALTALGGVGGSLLSVGAGMGDATPVALTVLVSSVVLTALAVAVDAHDNSPLVARLDLEIGRASCRERG